MKFTALFTLAFSLVSFAALAADGPAKIGQPAPEFSLKDQDGKAVSLADYKDKVVVLEWFNEECPFVQKHYSEGNMNRLAAGYTEKGVVWLLVNSTKGKSSASNKQVAERWHITRPILEDSMGQAAHAFGAKTTPGMFVINKGTLVYSGAIDDNNSNKTSDIAGAKNYVAQALDEISAGKSVSEPETRSYGCSVKYAK